MMRIIRDQIVVPMRIVGKIIVNYIRAAIMSYVTKKPLS